MLTFFRTGLRHPGLDNVPRQSRWALRNLYFAHFALLDVRTGRHRYFERFSRGALEQAGAVQGALNVWLRNWRVKGETQKGAYTIRLAAAEKDISLQLTLSPRKPPAIHGQDGVSQKADGKGRASHYYSLTRLGAEGEIAVDGKKRTVKGEAWMDHEFGSNQLTKDQIGWDWLSLQLSNGRELMLYLMRRRGGGYDRNSSGTLVGADGGIRHLALSDYRFEATGEWKSPKSGATYPMGWRVRVPGEKIELTIRPLTQAQELQTEGSTRVTYWEGAVEASGKAGGVPVTGQGFVEMTGYAKAARPKF
jgi:predicted secreted hydrolase